MQSPGPDIEIFQAAACHEPDLKWYAIADTAQDKDLPGSFILCQDRFNNLLNLESNSEAALHSPYLVELCSPISHGKAWSWISRNARSTPCFSIIATLKSFDEIFGQLSACTQVTMPDRETMFFAFWDGVILGSLVGQSDDNTLHIPGPVLSYEQQCVLMAGLDKWWYWDRKNTLRTIDIRSSKGMLLPGLLVLSQKQVDDLVEASVPDHVLSYIVLNQSNLINSTPPSERYDLVRTALVTARDIGLTSMRDLVDFVCLKLFYKEKFFQEIEIVHLLGKIKSGQINFRDAMNAFP